MRIFELTVTAVCLACSLAACASDPDAQQSTLTSPPGSSVVAERGQRVAERDCAGCHATGPSGDSPSAFAPPFRNLRLRYNPISLQRHVSDVVKNGVYSMPPQLLSTSDAEDIADYIEWLRPAPSKN
jgi:mono/diheme cytochrome c family protein